MADIPAIAASASCRAGLSIGNYERIWTEGKMLAYIRTDGHCRFLVALNFGDTPATLATGETGRVVLSTSEPSCRCDVADNVPLAANAGLIVELAPHRESPG